MVLILFINLCRQNESESLGRGGFGLYALVEPLDPLGALPDALALEALLVCVVALAVLLTVLPLAFVHPAVGPDELAEAVLFVVQVLSFEKAAVRPPVFALTAHLIALPAPVIYLIIWPDILAISFNVVHIEFALVVGAIAKE